MTERNGMPVYPGWETVGKLGSGSFGTVYEIRRDLFGKTERAALKHIRIPRDVGEIEELYAGGYDENGVAHRLEEQLADIVREYSLMAEMKGNSNVVNCDDILYEPRTDGPGWDILIRMELLTPLLKALSGGMTEADAVKLGKDLCRALALCRSRNVLHRDIKPQNVFVSADGDYKLGDFGAAQTMVNDLGATLAGSYGYMAPEVRLDAPYGHTADIYSLGLLLYWLLNERRGPFLPLPPAMPLAAEQDEARSRRFRGEPLPPPAHGSSALKRVVLSACAFEPEARYQTAEALSAALEAAMRGQYLPPAGRVKPGEDGPACGGFDLFAFGEEEEDDVSAIAPRRFLKASARTEGETVPGGLIFSPGEIDERETSVLPPDQRQILPPDAPGGDTLRADDTLRVTQPGGTYDGPTLTD